MNKRGTYGIIADDLRFDTQLSNVYGNAIRAKLAAAQTTRSVAGSFSSFVTQNLQSICSLYHRHPRFFHKSSESDSIANTGIPAIRHARCQKLFLFSLSVAKQKKKEGKIWNGSPAGMGHNWEWTGVSRQKAQISALFQQYKCCIKFTN